MKKLKTNRGFVRVDFKDSNGDECSLQESSIIEPHIWLGQNEPTKHHVTGELFCRMHLNQKQVKRLLPYLQKFVETGKL